MKKNILTLLIMLIGINIFAQKIKVDKGEIKLDDKTVGYIEGKKPLFKISNLDKSYTITAELKKIADPAAIPWIELKNESTTKFNELEFTKGKFSPFNHEKSLIGALLEHNYLTIEGLNVAAIESFINGDPTGVAAKLKGEKTNNDNQKNYIDSYQLTIDDAGVIYSIKAQNQDIDDKRIGFIRMTSPSSNGDLKYEVIDLDNNLVGTWFARGGMFSGYEKLLNQEVITFNGNVYKATFDNRGNPVGYKMSKDITAMNIVRVLVGNGYTLGTKYSAGK